MHTTWIKCKLLVFESRARNDVMRLTSEQSLPRRLDREHPRKTSKKKKKKKCNLLGAAVLFKSEAGGFLTPMCQ